MAHLRDEGGQILIYGDADQCINLNALHAAAPSGSAGGVLAGSYPNPGMAAGAAVANIGAAGLPISGIADPGAGKVIGSSSGAAAVTPPGFEIGYDQITSSVSITSTTEASGTAVISAAAHTFDGAAAFAEFFAPSCTLPQATGTTNSLVVSLFEGDTEIAVICKASLDDLATGQDSRYPLIGKIRFTPTAGSHTYTVSAYVSSTTGTPAVNAGVGGTDALTAAYVRFMKV